MKTFNVFQARLTKDQKDDVNKFGWDHSDVTKAYAGMQFVNEANAYDRYAAAVSAGLYKHNYIVDADDVEDVFTVTNHMAADAEIKWQATPARSTSVGDVIFEAGTCDGDMSVTRGWICCDCGWAELSGDDRRSFMKEVRHMELA